MVRRTRNRTVSALARLLGLVTLFAAVLVSAPESTARLQPYYLVRGSAAGQVKPRVVFAVDTSGSMIWRPSPANCPYDQYNTNRQCDCAWNECEDTSDPSKMSRIAGARSAIRTVVEATEGSLEFALMTFGSVPPPQNASEVPATCFGGARFAWVTEATAYAGGQPSYGPWGANPPPSFSAAQPGTWALCGQNRPFPYMRADEIGINVPSDFDPDNLPEGPLFDTWGGTWSGWTASSMANRRVQWLPAFMGIHFNIPCADVTTDSPVDRAEGDYTGGEMCDQDFFYVPYVDGFSGYPAMTGYTSSGTIQMGIHERAFNLTGTTDTCVRWTDACCEDWCQDNTDFQTCTEECDTTGTPPTVPPAVCDYYVDDTFSTPYRWAETRPALSCLGSLSTCSCSINGGTVDWPISSGQSSACSNESLPCITQCEAHCRSGTTVDAFGDCYDCVEDSCMQTCLQSNCDDGTGLAGSAPYSESCGTGGGGGGCGYYWYAGSTWSADDFPPSCSSVYDSFTGLYTCYCTIDGTSIPPFTNPTFTCGQATCIQACENNCASGCYSDFSGDFDCHDATCVADCAASYCTGGPLAGTNPGDPLCGETGGGSPGSCPSVSSYGCSEGTGYCECTVDGDTFDCSSDQTCWNSCKSSCQSSCGSSGVDYMGCAKECWETTCVGGGTPDCQEVCEDRTEECLDSCSGANSCPTCEEWESTSGTGNASLLSPFWNQGAIDRYDGIHEGPATAEDAHNTLVSLTSHPMYGGMGAQSGTPWSTAIGDVLYLPTDPFPSGPTNAAYSHNTVASYLSLMAHPDLGGTSACAPLSLVVITDGEPSPASSEGGTGLYSRLSALRTQLGVKTYVVGFTLDSTELNNMACAAAGGGGSTTPCVSSPAGGFDTCRDSDNPTTDCAFLASNTDELAEVLQVILVDQSSTQVPAGQGSAVNEFIRPDNQPDSTPVQTAVEGYTQMPDFEGHVERRTCDANDFPVDTPAEELEFCNPIADLEIEDAETGEAETFSMCTADSCVCDTFSRQWDAGTCLAETPYGARRLYTYRESGGTLELVRMFTDDGSGGLSVTTEFGSMLSGTAAANLGLPDLDADQQLAFAEFLAGKDWPNDWKLAGLGESVPVVVRRIPEWDDSFRPSVPIRDPHCEGRLFNTSEDVPTSLQEFAAAAWDPDNRVAATADFNLHRDYQEAVLVGSDAGFLHAFQLDSGNELFGFMPPFFLDEAYAMFLRGPENQGQPEAISDRQYGLSSTVNHGWVFDEDLGTEGDWRHLAVVGMGPGGKEYMILDITHMGRLQSDEPIEVLWSTEDSAHKATFDDLLGETWSRPALTYSFPGATDRLSMATEPKAHLVFASGYADATPTSAGQGRTLVLADALDGTVQESVRVPLPADLDLQYEQDSAVVNDIAVSSHCLSAMWAEMQEAYFADPMGGLYRWDLGLDPGDTAPQHAADSGGLWSTNTVGGVSTAIPAFRFRACQGTGDTCTVDTADGKYDYFTFGPAVGASGRFTNAQEQDETDQFVVALVSGAPDDDAVDPGRSGNDFHSSIYLLVDDHRTDQHGGFSILNGGDKTITESFFRIALSDITRDRVFTPYPGAGSETETATFARGTRPIQPPQISMFASIVDPAVTEIYFRFVVYEPGSLDCDPRFYDATTGTWYSDPGSTYEIYFRLTAGEDGFDFINGSGSTAFDDASDPDAPGVYGAGLGMGVRQVGTGDCGAGGCGANTGSPFSAPCDPNNYNSTNGQAFSIPMSHNELVGFTPAEESAAP